MLNCLYKLDLNISYLYCICNSGIIIDLCLLYIYRFAILLSLITDLRSFLDINYSIYMKL